MSSNGATSTKLPRPRSAAVFDGPDRAHSRAYMKGVGFDDEALSRPTIGIARTAKIPEGDITNPVFSAS